MLSLCIPGLVESDELENIARGLKKVDARIPFTILAFLPQYRMMDFKHPTVQEVVDAYLRVKNTGLENIRIGNIGVFVGTEKDQEYLQSRVAEGSF